MLIAVHDRIFFLRVPDRKPAGFAAVSGHIYVAKSHVDLFEPFVADHRARTNNCRAIEGLSEIIEVAGGRIERAGWKRQGNLGDPGVLALPDGVDACIDDVHRLWKVFGSCNAQLTVFLEVDAV